MGLYIYIYLIYYLFLDDFKADSEKSKPDSEFLKTVHPEQVAKLEVEIERLKSESKREIETFRSQHESTQSENHRLAEEIERLKSENGFQLQNLNEMQFSYDSLQANSSSEIEKLNFDLQESLSNNQGLESKLIHLTSQLERIEFDYKYVLHNKQNLESELNNMKSRQDEDQKEVINSKNAVQNLCDIVKSKNAVISQLKLSEERYDLEVRKLKKIEENFKAASPLADNYNLIKSNLKKVFSNDQQFCNTLSSEDNLENISDSEICEIVDFVLNDYISTKQNHFNELQKSMEKFNHLKTIFDQKLSSHNNLKKMFYLKVAEFKKKMQEMQIDSRKFETLSSEKAELVKKLDESENELKRMKRKLSDTENGTRQQLTNLKVIVDQKNKKLVELQNELLTLKKIEPKLSSNDREAFRQLKSDELQLRKSISGLKEVVETKESLITVLQKNNFILEDKLKKKSLAKKSLPVVNGDETVKLRQQVLQLQSQVRHQQPVGSNVNEIRKLKEHIVQLKQQLIASNPMETRKLKDQIVQLQAQHKRQEGEYNKRVHTFIKNLDGMKEKVKSALSEKDDEIEQLKKQLQSKGNINIRQF